jgi:hypothetical protein
MFLTPCSIWGRVTDKLEGVVVSVHVDSSFFLEDVDSSLVGLLKAARQLIS